MKKFKSLLIFCLASVMTFAIAIAAGCSSCSTDNDTLNSISLNVDNVRLFYVVGDEFSSEGLVVSGLFTNANGEEDTRDLTAEAVVDSSAFNTKEAGIYEIVVSYTYNEVTKEASYNVTVLAEPREGLLVTYADNTRSQTVNLTADKPTATIDYSDLVVKYVNYNQVQGEITDYTVKVYKEDKEITDLSGLGDGTYQIWVSANSKELSGYVLEDFVFVYVLLSVSDFTWVDGTTTQDIGIDGITSSWTYSVKTSIGGTISLDANDVDVVIDPLSVGDNKTATAYYTYYNAKGEATTLTANVSYNIVKGNKTVASDGFKWSEITGLSNGNAVTQAVLNASEDNSFLTLAGGTVNYRTKASGADDCIEIRGNALQVTFTGVGTLTISARSTGSSNLSSLGVKNADGKYMSGRVIEYAETAKELVYDEGIMYEVTASSSTKAPVIEFVIPAPGTYTIFTNDNDPDGSSLYARNTRVYSIEMKDVYESTSTASEISALSELGVITEINLYNEEV